MADYERLTVLDELFLHLEDPNTHMHVGGVAIFDGPAPDREDILEMIQRRLHLVPRFRQRLATVPFGVGRPVWVDDLGFDLEYHVRHTALPAPGDRARLNRLAAGIMSQQLDRSKPLWEIWVAEGLSDGSFALISKTHHCLVDGVSGADIMSAILDFGPETADIHAEAWRPEPEPSQDTLLAEALHEKLASPKEMVQSLQSIVNDPSMAANRIVEGAKAVGEFVAGSFGAPPSSLNRAIGPHRRFETVLADLGELKAIKDHHGTTINDVVLAAVAGGLRRLLTARGESVDGIELRAMVPVSVRAGAERGALGNRIAAVWASLPVYESDPVVRLRIVGGEMRALKGSGQAVGAQVLTALGEWAPPTVVAQAARLVARQRAFNLAVTNVPGPQAPLFTLGRRMQEVYPVLPLAANTCLGVALFSYDGTVGFGLLGDYDGAGDLGVLAEGIEKSIAELAGDVS